MVFKEIKQAVDEDKGQVLNGGGEHDWVQSLRIWAEENQAFKAKRRGLKRLLKRRADWVHEWVHNGSSQGAETKQLGEGCEKLPDPL